MAASGGQVFTWALSPDDKIGPTIPYEAYSGVSVSDNGRYFAIFLLDLARVWEYDGSSYKETASIINKANVLRLNVGNKNLVATASADNLITLWLVGEALSDNLRGEACRRFTRNLNRDEWSTYLAPSLGAYRKTCPDLP